MKKIIFLFIVLILVVTFKYVHQQSERWLAEEKQSLTTTKQEDRINNYAYQTRSYRNEKTETATSYQQKISLVSEEQEDRINGYAYQTYHYRIKMTFVGDFDSSTGGGITFKNLDTGESFSLTGITFNGKELCNGIKKGKSLDELMEEVKKENLLSGIWIFNYESANAYLSGERHLLWIMGSLRNNGKAGVTISLKTLENKETIFYADATAEQLKALTNI